MCNLGIIAHVAPGCQPEVPLAVSRKALGCQPDAAHRMSSFHAWSLAGIHPGGGPCDAPAPDDRLSDGYLVGI